MLEELSLSGSPGLRVKLPNLFSIFRIKRNHTIGGGGEVQYAINHQRSGFERSNRVPVGLIAAAVGLSHMIRPRSLQSADVCSVDFLELGKPSAARVASVKSPFLRGDPRRHQHQTNQTPQDSREHARQSEANPQFASTRALIIRPAKIKSEVVESSVGPSQ